MVCDVNDLFHRGNLLLDGLFYTLAEGQLGLTAALATSLHLQINVSFPEIDESDFTSVGCHGRIDLLQQQLLDLNHHWGRGI